MVFILFDSRARVRTGRRRAYQFPETQAGAQAIWDLVHDIEVPDDLDSYAYLAHTPVFDCVEVFNDYWACYGWYVNVYEDDAPFPEDVDVGVKR